MYSSPAKSRYRPLNVEEAALLPADLLDQQAATPALCGDRWLILSAEPAHTPRPQTRRLEAAMRRIGLTPTIVSSSRLEVQGCLKTFSTLRDDAEPVGPPQAVQNPVADNSIARLARDLVEYALTVRASDIHLECRNTGQTRVRFRCEGRLAEGPFPLRNRQAESLAHYLFSLGRSGNRQWQKSTACDGVVDLEVQTERRGPASVHLRLGSFPEVRGWDLAIRLFTWTDEHLGLADTGYDEEQMAMIREACSRPYGAILFSGPTGSGKSTSMFAALAELPDWTKIVSLEQPVEQILPNISHMTAGLASDLADAAPALNRCDADVAVLGEVRDRAGAEVLADFTTAGKLTLATVHAARISSIPLRLRELGIQPGLICDPTFLTALVSQRLLPRLCTGCRLPVCDSGTGLPDWYLRKSHLRHPGRENQIFVRGTGCDLCSGGCNGRVLIAEVLLLDDADFGFLAAQDFEGWRRSLRQSKVRSIEQAGQRLVYNGLVDPLDAERSFRLSQACPDS